VSAEPNRGSTLSQAILVLEDGRTFRGEAYGAVGTTVGEAVFATGMTGYQETLTDPSYHRQVVVMTAPHIGNTGVNGEDDESRKMWVAGFVVRDPARRPANWRATGSLDDELVAQGVVGISGIDTRALTRHLRDRGAMRVGISSEITDADELLARVTAAESMVGADLAPQVSTGAAYVVPAVGEKRYTIAALDLGIKTATPRHLAELGVETHVLPATATAEDLLAHGPDGVFLQAALRPPRTQPAGARPGQRHRAGDQPQPRLRRRRPTRPAHRHPVRPGGGQPRGAQRRRRRGPALPRRARVQRPVPPGVRGRPTRRRPALQAVRRPDGGAAQCLRGPTSST
jgi:hypothetical protein